MEVIEKELLFDDLTRMGIHVITAAMNYNMLKQLTRIHQNDCVMIDGTLRNKATFERYRCTRKMMFAMMTSGYITIAPEGVTLTPKGYRAVTKTKSAKTQRDHYQARRDRGYVNRKVWIHEDDVERFTEMMKGFK